METLDQIFHALADQTRREMLHMLAIKEHSVTELAAPFEMSLQSVSKHIKVLEKAGLLQRKVQGRKHTCQLNPSTLAAAHQWLRYYEKFWNERLDILERELHMQDQLNSKLKHGGMNDESQ